MQGFMDPLREGNILALGTAAVPVIVPFLL